MDHLLRQEASSDYKHTTHVQEIGGDGLDVETTGQIGGC